MTMTMMMMMTDQVKRYLTVKRPMMMTEQVKRDLTVKRSRDQDGHNACRSSR